MHPMDCRSARRAWHPEFAMEGALLAAFMISALAFTIVAEHPASPMAQPLPPLARRLIVGLGMAATAIVLIYSPWGRRSGAHMNPAATLALARLGKVPAPSVPGYIAAQFIGGAGGAWVGWQAFGPLVEHPAVRFAVTRPGAWGTPAAFAAELLMTFVQLSAVLLAARDARWRPYAGAVAASMLVAFITFEAPISGMSLNPARTLASAVWSGDFTAIWIYFLAPVLGMLLAAEIFVTRAPRGPAEP